MTGSAGKPEAFLVLEDGSLFRGRSVGAPGIALGEAVFTTAMSGTPQTSVIDPYVPLVYTERGDLGRTEMFTQTDLTLSHSYNFGRDNKFKIVGDITRRALPNPDREP